MITVIAPSVYNRPDFIETQHKSLKKFLKCDFKYIVINNAKFSKIDQTKDSNYLIKEIKQICEKLDIETYEVTECQNVLNKSPAGNINGGKYSADPYACNYAMQWVFDKIIPQTNGKVFLVDSDLFLINDINLEKSLDEFDAIYIPQYRGNNVKYIWNMCCGFNFINYPKLLDLNWTYTTINGHRCDVGANTHFFLKENDKMRQLPIEEHSIYEIEKEKDNQIKMHYVINGNSNYYLKTDLNFNIIEFNCKEKYCQNKTFEYEKDHLDYQKYIQNNLKKISEIFLANQEIEKLPKPIRLGFVKRYDDDNFFGLHYRSAANYLNYSTEDYNQNKTKLIKTIINR